MFQQNHSFCECIYLSNSSQRCRFRSKEGRIIPRYNIYVDECQTMQERFRKDVSERTK